MMWQNCRLKHKFIVGCQGVVKLGVPDPWYNLGGPAKVGARKSFLLTESSLVVKIKNPWLILLSHFSCLIASSVD